MASRLLTWLTIAYLCVPIEVGAATVNLDGDVLVVSGELAISDERSFFAPFETSSIRAIRFEDCLGGQFGPYDALRQLIETHRVRTEARGVVASGCALAFMAGDSRTLLDNARGDTQLIFHGVFNRLTGEPFVDAIERLRLMLIERSKGRTDADRARQMINEDDRRSTFRVLQRARLIDGQPVSAFRCPFIDGAVRCETVDGVTAESLGLVTPVKSTP